jgi:hydrogenase maturation protease
MRTLIAGFGNMLRGDDGFGVEVIRRLETETLGDEVHLIDVGTGGIHLAHALMERYDRVVIVDAMARGQAPGTLYFLEVEEIEAEKSVDMHLVLPARALGLAKALGVLPPSVIMVGCEPAEVDELTLELSPLVHKAVTQAVDWITGFVGAASAKAAIGD